MSARAARAWLISIGLLALALRLVGIGYGLPAIYNMDEVAIMNRALAFATGDLNPHNFLYPTLYFYVLFAWEGLVFLLGWAFGVFDSLTAFQREFFVDPSRLYLVGRGLTVLCGVLTVTALYRLGSRVFGRTAGVLSALFLATAPFAVRDAHYIKHDVPVTFLVVLTHVALAGLVVVPERRRLRRAWAGVGVLAGLAISTHYYAVFLVLPVAAVALMPAAGTPDPIGLRLRNLTTAGLFAITAFLLASPFLLPEAATAWRDIVQNREIVMDRAVASGGLFASLGRYLEMLWSEAIGWPVAAFGAGGLALVSLSDRRRAVLLALYPVTFLVFIGNTVPAGRYLNPVLPFVALAAAYTVVRLAGGVATGIAWARTRPEPIAAIVGLAAAWPGALVSYGTSTFFTATDTRTLAQAFIEREIPAGSSVLVQPYSVALRQSREGLVEALRATRGSEESASTKFRLLLDLNPYPAPAYRTIYLGIGGLDADKIYVSPRVFDDQVGLEPLRRIGVEYVVIKRFPDADPSFAGLDRGLAREGRLLATFSPYRDDAAPAARASVQPFLHNTDARLDGALGRPGPTIEVWRVLPGSGDPRTTMAKGQG